MPKALGRLGVKLLILMPRYRGVDSDARKLSENVSIHFIENEAYFNRASLYGNSGGDYPDNLKRFSFFCHEALIAAKKIGFKPDLIHANDWQTALLPVLLKTNYAADAFFKETKSLLTIHNLAYQGQFSHRQFAELGLDASLFSMEGFEFYGKVNVLKAGLLFADAINAVSPHYAEEIMTHEYGFGLDGVIQKRKDRLHGILNGIDESLWNPEKDSCIKKKFSIRSLAGKKICKSDLQQRMRLEVDEEIPVFAMVTRLAQQKGLDLLLECMDRFLAQRAQFVLLGEGDGIYETSFRNLTARNPKKVMAQIGYDSDQAHRIYAGADFFLMPSIYEPCGLGQMISLRYGTIPIVRRTGGLADTIVDIDADPKNGLPASPAGNGIVFGDHKAPELMKALERAMDLFKDPGRLESIRKLAMQQHFSWTESAKAYRELYEEALG